MGPCFTVRGPGLEVPRSEARRRSVGEGGPHPKGRSTPIRVRLRHGGETEYYKSHTTWSLNKGLPGFGRRSWTTHTHAWVLGFSSVYDRRPYPTPVSYLYCRSHMCVHVGSGNHHYPCTSTPTLFFPSVGLVTRRSTHNP